MEHLFIFCHKKRNTFFISDITLVSLYHFLSSGSAGPFYAMVNPGAVSLVLMALYLLLLESHLSDGHGVCKKTAFI